MKSYEIESYIGENEMPVTVKFDYSPAEKMILHPIDMAYPGSPGSVEITEIIAFGQLIEDIRQSDMDRIQTECEDSI